MPRNNAAGRTSQEIAQSEQPNTTAASDQAAQPAAKALKPRRKASSPAKLTKRQAVVLRLVASGLTNKEVAERLGLSIHTIESHLHAVYGKLGVTNRGAAIRFAVDHDLD